ncbi:hypothetical protein GCM10023191_007770 [Actinoallomurus oryzae]|uniref:Uncharacterized protein n=1 Tax=Actinoallomurus oryzae TaxID=502180 RepID=A0ABP8PCT7_9ACTN
MPPIPVWIVAKESLRFKDTPGARPGAAYLTADEVERYILTVTAAEAALWVSSETHPRPVLAYRVIPRSGDLPVVVLGAQGFSRAMFPADAELIGLLSHLLEAPPPDLLYDAPPPAPKKVPSLPPAPRKASPRRKRAQMVARKKLSTPKVRRKPPPPVNGDPAPQLAKGSRTPSPDPPKRRMHVAPVQIVSGGLPGLGKRR